MQLQICSRFTSPDLSFSPSHESFRQALAPDVRMGLVSVALSVVPTDPPSPICTFSEAEAASFLHGCAPVIGPTSLRKRDNFRFEIRSFVPILSFLSFRVTIRSFDLTLEILYFFSSSDDRTRTCGPVINSHGATTVLTNRNN